MNGGLSKIRYPCGVNCNRKTIQQTRRVCTNLYNIDAKNLCTSCFETSKKYREFEFEFLGLDQSLGSPCSNGKQSSESFPKKISASVKKANESFTALAILADFFKCFVKDHIQMSMVFDLSGIRHRKDHHVNDVIAKKRNLNF